MGLLRSLRQADGVEGLPRSNTCYVLAGATPVLVHNSNNKCPTGVGNSDAPEPLGRGSTGDTAPRSLKEQIAMKQAMSDPASGFVVPLKKGMTDPRWEGSDGWQKMSQNIDGTEIHYVYNPRTGQVDEILVSLPLSTLALFHDVAMDGGGFEYGAGLRRALLGGCEFDGPTIPETVSAGGDEPPPSSADVAVSYCRHLTHKPRQTRLTGLMEFLYLIKAGTARLSGPPSPTSPPSTPAITRY